MAKRKLSLKKCTTPGCDKVEYHFGLCSHLELPDDEGAAAGRARRRTRAAAPLDAAYKTPAGGHNRHGLQRGDRAFLDAGGSIDARIPVELLDADAEKPIVIVVDDTDGMRSLCTTWIKLSPLVQRGEYCWYAGGGRSPKRQQRQLARLERTVPGPCVHLVAQGGVARSSIELLPFWAELDPLSTFELELLHSLLDRGERLELMAQLLADADARASRGEESLSVDALISLRLADCGRRTSTPRSNVRQLD